ncbi:MAG: ribosome biogenesis GTPase Der [Bacteroidota bacterium]
MSNIIAIVGRPNVGKSTLFNRLTESRKAIVDEMSGVTRDRNYGKAQWNGIEFSVIDTGGYVIGSEDIFEKQIRSQVEVALNETNIILFMVDITTGITKQDEKVAQYLRKIEMKKDTEKKIFLIANKADTNDIELQSGEFYKLGMGEVHCISSISGKGTGELLDLIVKSFKEKADENISDLPRFAIVGRPNVGKSSLLNVLLGEERAIVTEIAGTTRDTINTQYKKFNHNFLLIDTAGIRKKRKFEEDVEFYSIMRAVRAIENCNVCLLVLDASRGMEAQDVNIFRLADRNKKGIIILVNKWDLIEKETNSVKEFEENIRKRIAPFSDVPIVFISVLNKQRIMKVVEEAEKVFQNKKKKISDEELTEFLFPIVQNHPPASEKGKLVDIKSVIQVPASFPVFAVFCNLPKAIKESYRRFLENKIREKFDFSGVPIQIHFRKK